MRAASVTSAIHPKVSSEAEATIAQVVIADPAGLTNGYAIAARRAGEYRGPVPKGLRRNEAICLFSCFEATLLVSLRIAVRTRSLA